MRFWKCDFSEKKRDFKNAIFVEKCVYENVIFVEKNMLKITYDIGMISPHILIDLVKITFPQIGMRYS